MDYIYYQIANTQNNTGNNHPDQYCLSCVITIIIVLILLNCLRYSLLCCRDTLYCISDNFIS